MKQLEMKSVNSSNYCNEIFDGTHDSPKYHEFGYPLVTSKHLTLTSINVKDAPLIEECDYIKINKRSLVKKHDVLISMIGTIGIIAFVKNEPYFAIKNIGVMRAKDEIDAKYLYYYMQSNSAQHQIKSEIEGSTQHFLSLSKLRNFPIFVPIDESKKQHIVDTARYCYA